MKADELDRQAKARRFVRGILADLRLLGYTDDELRGCGIEKLLQLHRSGFRRIMSEAPVSRHAA